MKNKLLLIGLLCSFCFPLSVFAFNDESIQPIVSQATNEEFEYLVNELGFDTDYIKILPKERIEYLKEHSGIATTTDRYYKTYEKPTNITGFQTFSMSDPLVGKTIELSKEEYEAELEQIKNGIMPCGSDLQGRYDSSYRHFSVTRSKLNTTTAHYVLELYWDILPKDRELDYLSFVTNSSNAYGRNFYSAQLFSYTANSYTNTTSTWSDNTKDNVTYNGGHDTNINATNYSVPFSARYDLVDGAKAIKLVHSFDVYNLPAGKVVSSIHNHGYDVCYETNKLAFYATAKSNPDVPGGGTVNIRDIAQIGLDRQGYFNRLTYMLTSY